MKQVKIWLLALISVLAFVVLPGCTNKKGREGLTIGFYLGGYGRQWAETLAAKFEAETGIIVNLEPDASILSKIETKLKNGSDEDLFFSHDITWERFVALDYLEPLDDLYASEVENGVTFEQRVIDIAREPSKAEGRYYKVPWTQGVGGIVYNKQMFADNAWEIPETYEDLVSLCALIAGDPNLKNTAGKKIAPFVWAGNDSWTWDYVVFEWWAQLAGTEHIMDNLMKYESAETFNPDSNWKQMKEAFTAWYDLIAKNPSYSVTGSNGATKLTAQMSFVAGEAAMIPEGHWFYHEAKDRAPAGFEMAVMDTPVLMNAKEGYEKVNYLVGFGDSAVIPKKSKNKEAAKEFLRFMAREDNCKIFTELTDGTRLAYQYEMSDESRSNPFIESIDDKLNDSKSFHDYSNNQMAVLLYETLMVWPENNYYYVSAFNNPTKNNPTEIFNYIYEECKSNWQLWKNQAGM